MIAVRTDMSRRLTGVMALGAVLGLSLTGCVTGPGPQSPKPSHYSVRQSCGQQPGCFKTIQSAVDAAASDKTDRWAIVDIAPGNYYEKITVTRPRTKLHGQGKATTRLYFDAVAQTAGHYHRNKWGTPGSATLTVDADQVSVDGLTVENTFDYLTNDALPDKDPRKIGNSQGVAVLLDIHSDRVMFDRSALVGYQDTLFANGGRVFVRNSHISGNVDFIFGNGQVLIEDSVVQTRRRAPTSESEAFESFIVAPSTQLSQTIGIVIYRSHLTREDGVRDGAVALGRPWHPTTTFADGRYADPNAVGQASFIDCFMDGHIHRDHWAPMNGTARDGTKTAIFYPQDSRFSETGSYGPGAAHSDIGIRWQQSLTIDQIHSLFFDGWPQSSRHR